MLCNYVAMLGTARGSQFIPENNENVAPATGEAWGRSLSDGPNPVWFLEDPSTPKNSVFDDHHFPHMSPFKMPTVGDLLRPSSHVLLRTEGYNRYCWVWHLAGELMDMSTGYRWVLTPLLDLQMLSIAFKIIKHDDCYMITIQYGNHMVSTW